MSATRCTVREVPSRHLGPLGASTVHSSISSPLGVSNSEPLSPPCVASPVGPLTAGPSLGDEQCLKERGTHVSSLKTVLTRRPRASRKDWQRAEKLLQVSGSRVIKTHRVAVVEGTVPVSHHSTLHLGPRAPLCVQLRRVNLRGSVALLALLHQSALDWAAETAEVCFLTVLEAGSLKSRCQRGFLLRAVREGPIPGRSLWCVTGHLLPESSLRPPSVRGCVLSPLPMRTRVLLGRTTLMTSF